MSNNENEEKIEILAKELEEDLLRMYGPIISGDDLIRCLGYPSKDAYRQAVTRKTYPVPLFEFENRRGKYSLAKDIAKCLAERRCQAIASKD